MLEKYKAKLTQKEVVHYIYQYNAFFAGFPHLPDVLLEFLVKVIPYLVIVGAYLSLIFQIHHLFSQELVDAEHWHYLRGGSSMTVLGHDRLDHETDEVAKGQTVQRFRYR